MIPDIFQGLPVKYDDKGKLYLDITAAAYRKPCKPAPVVKDEEEPTSPEEELFSIFRHNT